MSPPHTPTSRSRSNAQPEANTIKKSRFFHAIDCRKNRESIKEICDQESINHATGKKWLSQRKRMGFTSEASRRIGKHRSGRPKKLSAEKLNEMLNPEKNPVRSQQWECQIEHFHLNCNKRTLQRAFKKRTSTAGRYKKAKIRKIDEAVKQKRVDYARQHIDETVESFWQFVHFTDESHIDPTKCFSERVLREEGSRYAPENYQEVSKLEGVIFHIAASVSWHHKGPLQFYNDEHEPPPVQVKKPGKPRKRKAESEAQFRNRVVEWEAKLPHETKVKSSGNSMTMAYYVGRLLPVYAQSIKEARNIHNRWAILQEDNDPSHGTKSSDNMAKRFKTDNEIFTIVHPSFSPDLNPIEAVWNVLKQRVKRRVWRSKSQLKDVILEEWERIPMDEIRARIKELPNRCKTIVETGGKPIKSALW